MPIGPDKEKALDGQYPADLYIRLVGGTTWTNLGAVRGAVATWGATDVTEIISDNRGTLKRFAKLNATISATILEPQDADKLNLLFNSTRTLTAATPVNVSNEIIGTDVPSGTIYTLKFKNGNNTQVSNIVVTAGNNTLTLNTDYKVGVDSNGYTYVVFLVNTTGETKVSYTYTPNSSIKEDITAGSTELKNFEIRLEATLGTKKRTITITSATLKTDYSTNFADITEAKDIKGTELTFESNKGAIISYYDEIL